MIEDLRACIQPEDERLVPVKTPFPVSSRSPTTSAAKGKRDEGGETYLFSADGRTSPSALFRACSSHSSLSRAPSFQTLSRQRRTFLVSLQCHFAAIVRSTLSSNVQIGKAIASGGERGRVGKEKRSVRSSSVNGSGREARNTDRVGEGEGLKGTRSDEVAGDWSEVEVVSLPRGKRRCWIQ